MWNRRAQEEFNRALFVQDERDGDGILQLPPRRVSREVLGACFDKPKNSLEKRPALPEVPGFAARPVSPTVVGDGRIRTPRTPVKKRPAQPELKVLSACPIRRTTVGGSPGVRQRLECPGKWVVEFRFRASNWKQSKQQWVGTFDTEEEAMLAYDTAKHFLGYPTYYYECSDDFFERCPRRFTDTPETAAFVNFVKEKANQYAMHARELQSNVPISEAAWSSGRILTNQPMTLTSDGEDGATSDIQAPLVPSAAAFSPRRRRASAPEVTHRSMSTNSELVGDTAVELMQLVSTPSQTMNESTFADDGVNFTDSDVLAQLDGLPLYVFTEDDMVAGFTSDWVSSKPGASGRIAYSLERPFL